MGIKSGDGLLLRIETNRGVPRESVFGRREDVGRTVRLVSGEILAADALGEFALQPTQGIIRALFVPLSACNRSSGNRPAPYLLLASTSKDVGLSTVRAALRAQVTLQDVGVTLRALPSTTASLSKARKS